MPFLLMLSLLTFADVGSSSSDSQFINREPCGATDIECVLRLLQQKALEAESYAKQLEIAKQQNLTAQELIEVWKAQAQSARDAAKEAMAALRPMAWYQSPVLWTAVGLTIGVALAVGIVYALRPAFILTAN
jgi:hypothetical protein